MGEKQDLHLLLRAARRLKDNANIHFYVFGDGAVKREFLRVRDDWGLANVSHFPLQERSLLPHMLYGADICLVTQLPEVVDIVVPSKLITAMGAGAMIVAACAEQSETASLLRASGGGIVVPASDDQAVMLMLCTAFRWGRPGSRCPMARSGHRGRRRLSLPRPGRKRATMDSRSASTARRTFRC
jgi:hypothetical protein